MRKEGEALNAILSITPMIILLGFITAAISSEFLKTADKSICNSEQKHEDFMASVWKIYGRKQPQRVIG